MCFTVGQIKEKPFARGSTPRGHYRVVSGVVERERKRGREFSGPWTASNLALLSFFISLSSKGARRSKNERAFSTTTLSDCRVSSPPSFVLFHSVRVFEARGHSTASPLSPFSSPFPPSVSCTRKTAREILW